MFKIEVLGSDKLGAHYSALEFNIIKKVNIAKWLYLHNFLNFIKKNPNKDLKIYICFKPTSGTRIYRHSSNITRLIGCYNMHMFPCSDC